MNPQRMATVGAVVVIAVSMVYLLGWWLLWRILITHPLAPQLFVMPLSAATCIFTSAGLLSALGGGAASRTRIWAAVIVLIAGGVLVEYMAGTHGGFEQWLLGEQTQALLGGATPGRPAPQAAAILLCLGVGLWLAPSSGKVRIAIGPVAIGLAVFVSFTTFLGHLYEARALYQPTGNGQVISPVETLMLLTLSVAALALNPRGIAASYAMQDASGAAKRRLLPPIVLTPVLLGLFQYLSVKYDAMELSMALALTVTANILVFIALSEWVSRLLVRIEEERTGAFVQRESQAKAQGMTDTLTQLANRRGWDLAVKEAEERCKKEHLNAAVIVIDLDGLKRINDTLGHAKGDEFIRRAATALRTGGRREDTLARLGGDEFAYLSVGCEPEHAAVVLSRLSQALQRANVPASLGYAMRDLAGSIGAAFQEADQSMYAHKRARKSQAAQAGSRA